MSDDVTFLSGRFGRVAVLRLRPNQDIGTAIEDACVEAGLRGAILRAALGSLNDAVYRDADGGTRTVGGPGLEIVSLTGQVTPAADGRVKADLTATVADRDGNLSGGRLAPGCNIICITAEIVLQEWLPDEPTQEERGLRS